LVVVFVVHHRPSSLSVIGDHRPSQSIAVAIAICRQSLLSIVSRRRLGRRCPLSLSVFVIGLCHWLSVIIIVVVVDSSLVVVIGCQLSVIIIVAVGHGRECDRRATSCGRCTFMAEGTTSVEPAGGAEKATAARREALEPRAHGRAENGVL